MKTTDNETANDSREVSGNATGNCADFPINEDLLLDEVAKKKREGFKHTQLEADESQQHPETRKGQKVSEETRLDEVMKNEPTEYPDIE